MDYDSRKDNNKNVGCSREHSVNRTFPARGYLRNKVVSICNVQV